MEENGNIGSERKSVARFSNPVILLLVHLAPGSETGPGESGRPGRTDQCRPNQLREWLYVLSFMGGGTRHCASNLKSF